MDVYDNYTDQDGNNNIPGKTICSPEEILTSNFSDLIYAYALVNKAAASTSVQHYEITEEIGEKICSACDDLLNAKVHEKLIINIIQMKTNISKKFKIHDVLTSIISKNSAEADHLRDTDKLTSYLHIIQSDKELCQAGNKISILLSFSRIKREMKKIYTLLQQSSSDKNSDRVNNPELSKKHKSLAAIVEADLFLFDKLQISLREIHLSFELITDPKRKRLYARDFLNKLISLTGISLQQVNNIEEDIDTGIFVILSSALKRYAINLSTSVEYIQNACSARKLLNNIDTHPGTDEQQEYIKCLELLTSIKQASCQVIGIDLSISLLSQTNKTQINYLDTQITLNILEAITILTNATLALNKILSQLNEIHLSQK